MQTVVAVSGWQIAGTIATACAVAVALTAVIVNIVQRKRDNDRRDAEKETEALAQARLVIVGGNPGSEQISVDAETYGLERDDTYGEAIMWESRFGFANHGQRPVLDVYGQIWPSGYRLSDRPLEVTHRFVLPGEDKPIPLRMPEKLESLAAWRVRWTDADGRQWFVDKYPYEQPERYHGQEPQQY